MNAKTIDSKIYEVSEEIENVALDVLSKESINIEPAKITYLKIFPNINKNTIAQCVCARKELKFFSGVDYVIKVSGEIWDKIDNKTRYILMFHELLHICPVYNEKKGIWSFKVVDHDVKDFYKILDRYGIAWFNNIRSIINSMYDLTPEEQDKVKL